ncbi:hypothetical protein [Vibrio coralliilyticus]|uniref:hypothetical protein n=1 Tax=Vibrio coralliilyticus TaxID=190893 RepID=UPI0017EEF8AD|nr:hypothetical protein [Vibrio coralliilyticus]NUW66927.1 hypothetical protein [Vibrio coralliilyticus]NUW70897.1 hypothetical protein [Vibrio coralliilyticus]
MERCDIEFDINYSYTLELYHQHFYTRLDHLLTSLQLFLGSLVFANFTYHWFYGAVITVLAIIGFVYKPAVKALMAQRQVHRFGVLIDAKGTLTDDELQKRTLAFSKGKTDHLGVFIRPAFNRACLMQGSQEGLYRLTPYQRIMAWLAGDLPAD